MNTIAQQLKTEAVEAWRAAQENGNELTATELGFAVARFAEAAGLDPAQAMQAVRTAGQAQIDAEAPASPQQQAAPTPAARPVYRYRIAFSTQGRVAFVDVNLFQEITGPEVARQVATMIEDNNRLASVSVFGWSRFAD